MFYIVPLRIKTKTKIDLKVKKNHYSFRRLGDSNIYYSKEVIDHYKSTGPARKSNLNNDSRHFQEVQSKIQNVLNNETTVKMKTTT